MIFFLQFFGVLDRFIFIIIFLSEKPKNFFTRYAIPTSSMTLLETFRWTL